MRNVPHSLRWIAKVMGWVSLGLLAWLPTPVKAGEVTLSVASPHLARAVYRFDDRAWFAPGEGPNPLDGWLKTLAPVTRKREEKRNLRAERHDLFNIAVEHQRRELADALGTLDRLCASQPHLCDRLPSLEVIIQDAPLSLNGESDCAEISENSTIAISAQCREISLSAFHEMVHAVQYAQGTDRRRGLRADWLFEGVAQLATLLYHPRARNLTQAENAFLHGELRGSLLYSGDNVRSWYGLIGLWTRYLRRHLSDPERLLREWIELDPARLEGDHALDVLDLSSHALQPRLPEPPAGTRRFENLFNYFVIALGDNESGLNSWNLFELDAPTPIPVFTAAPVLLEALPSPASVDLPPLGFFHARATVLKDHPRFTADPEVRITLWRQGRHAPVDLRQEAFDPNLLERFDSLVIYNPTLAWKTVTTSP